MMRFLRCVRAPAGARSAEVTCYVGPAYRSWSSSSCSSADFTCRCGSPWRSQRDRPCGARSPARRSSNPPESIACGVLESLSQRW